MNTSAPTHYALPADYRENPVLNTVDAQTGGRYWTAWRLRNSAHHQYDVYQHAIKILLERNSKTLIDVGCGPGIKLRHIHHAMPHVQITGIDQADPIAFCQANHSFGTWHVDDFEHPRAEIADVKGDLVLCSDVIEHVLDPDRLLAYLAAKVDQKGLVMMSTPDRDRLYGLAMRHSGNPYHVREWNAPEFKAYLQSRGWTIIDHFHCPGVRAGLNAVYVRLKIMQLLKKRPYSMDYNQVVVLRPPDVTTLS